MISLDSVLLVLTSKTFFLSFLISQNVTFIARSYRTFSIYVKFLRTASCWNSVCSWQRRPLFDELEGKHCCHIIIIIPIAIVVTMCSTFSTAAIFSIVLSYIDDRARILWRWYSLPLKQISCTVRFWTVWWHLFFISRLTSLCGDSMWLTRC